MKLQGRKNKLYYVLVILLLVAGYILLTIPKYVMAKNGLYVVADVMEACGYDYISGKYLKSEDVDIEIVFDIENRICKKNEYIFYLDEIYNVFYEDYIEDDDIQDILNSKVELINGKVIANPIVYSEKDWTEENKLIAHAGGAVREKGYTTYYTNSREALVQNYNLGHRVFEIDFYLTSDQKLAAVHDWYQFGTYDGVAFSAMQWKEFRTNGQPITEGRYTTMLIDDVLDEMLINKDMYIVTDTKSFELSEQETYIQFKNIYDEAMKKDPELLSRIIPQIYNEKMYEIIT